MPITVFEEKIICEQKQLFGQIFGRRVGDWITSREFVISNIYFPHPKIHKAA